MTNAARERFEALYHIRHLEHESVVESRRMMSELWNGSGYDNEHMDDCYYFYIALYAGDVISNG